MSTDEPGPALTRRELRERREREEREAREREAREAAAAADTAAQAAVVADAAQTAVTIEPVSDVLPGAAPSTPTGGTPSRRSMRERRPVTPSGTPGLGERVPATGAPPTRARVVQPAVGGAQPAAAPAAPPRVPIPSVPTPAAAQAVRTLDETGALSEVRTTRASEDSPVEVTGPVDWSAAAARATPTPAPAAGAAGPGSSSSSAASGTAANGAAANGTAADGASEAPARRSVLGRDAGPSWASVAGESGAMVPTPSEEAPPAVSQAFESVPVPPEAVATEAPAPRRRRFSWFSPLGYVLLALVGVAIGAGIYYLVFVN